MCQSCPSLLPWSLTFAVQSRLYLRAATHCWKACCRVDDGLGKQSVCYRQLEPPADFADAQYSKDCLKNEICFPELLLNAPA